MKKLKIRSCIRPATPEDIFDMEGLGSILENKQVFYKTNEAIRGPYNINSNLFFVDQKYQELYYLLSKNRIFVIDSEITEETILVELPIVEGIFSDLEQTNHYNNIMEHIIFYIIQKTKVNGPYKMTTETKVEDIKNRIKKQEFFVLDKPSNINQIKIETSAAAV